MRAQPAQLDWVHFAPMQFADSDCRRNVSDRAPRGDAGSNARASYTESR
jgi:hypothetical protein